MRFGWKAITTSVNQQSANGYLDDMELTTATGPNSTMATNGSLADINWENLDGVSYYTQTLAAHATDEASHNLLGKQGSALFDQLQGASCHVPSQRTGNNQQAVAKVIKDQTIWPYTDLLLREMGPSREEAIILHAGEATTA
ncbi:hypothetical protein PMIT1313_00209 [Prochlorococcus marinus str. MIT 1313]|uniref:di-heme oxidoredictase family protein n=1 Tax=Prochlorococcus TaxID=1218 RepID=UPI0007B31FD0|nr:hypothetical protein PMIT1313_00209 [Prochlorococcus marinus str. MIT 1313]KZR76905.1 hypothetical protein PMIT1318_00112 [Prochlorococcus marinus str. MIT 1318]